MTKEERAKKWFRNIPNAECMSMETKIRICSNVARNMTIVFFAILAVECILLFMVSKGGIFNYMADFLNHISEGNPTSNHHKGVALVGGLVCLPLMMLPIIAVLIFKNKRIKSEADKAIGIMSKDGTHGQGLIGHEREQLLEFSEQNYSDWTMDDGIIEQDCLTMKHIEQQLLSIKNGNSEFMILTPLKPLQVNDGCVCNFVQVCQDEDLDYFHVEVSTVDIEQNDDAVICGKDHISEEETKELLRGLLDNRALPNLHDWEIVVDMQMEKNSEIETYKAIVKLMTNHQVILSNMELCFSSPQQYFNENAEKYSNRGILEGSTTDTIVWVAIVDEMVAGDAAIELDWKEEKTEFLGQIKVLADKYHLELWEDLLEENGDIPTWCEVLDEKWIEQNFCVGAIDIDSDSYVLFICQREILKMLSALSKKVNHRIGFAKNM